MSGRPKKEQKKDRRWPTAAALVPSNNSKEQLIALADATSGTIGSLVALLVFYPIDVLKTRSQCAMTDDGSNNDNLLEVRGEPRQSRNRDTEMSVLSWLWCNRSSRLFQGLHWKAAHTILSSFTYFYMYSILASGAANNSSTSGTNTSATAPTTIQHLKPTTTELLISMAAAMINVMVTLPFDVLSTRAQHNTVQRVLKNSSCENAPSFTNTTTYINGVNDLILSLSKQIKSKIRRNLSDSWRRYRTSVPSLWSGIIPSLILCINPAINYTLYNILKRNYILLSWRRRRWCPCRQQQQQQQQGIKAHSEGVGRLRIIEAFLFGAVAKFLATIITYPLIRAKVLMMVKARKTDDTVGSESHRPSEHTISPTTGTTNGSPIRLWNVLQYMYRNDDQILGLYRGLSLQLLHTSLKSALLLMVRETITLYVRHLFSVKSGVGVPNQE